MHSNTPPEYNDKTAVRVVNNGERVFKAGYANTTYTLAPGESAFVPYYAAVLWAGDPFAVDFGKEGQNYRTQEMDRLNTRYGVYAEAWSTDEPYTIHDYNDKRESTNTVYELRSDGRYWHPNLPVLSVENSQGEVLRTVLVDPEGSDITPAQQTSIAQQRTLEDSVGELRRQLAEMQLRLAKSQETLPSDPDFEAAAVSDTPSVTPEPNPASKPTVGDPRSTRGPGRPRRT